MWLFQDRDLDLDLDRDTERDGDLDCSCSSLLDSLLYLEFSLQRDLESAFECPLEWDLEPERCSLTVFFGSDLERDREFDPDLERDLL